MNSQIILELDKLNRAFILVSADDDGRLAPEFISSSAAQLLRIRNRKESYISESIKELLKQIKSNQSSLSKSNFLTSERFNFQNGLELTILNEDKQLLSIFCECYDVNFKTIFEHSKKRVRISKILILQATDSLEYFESEFDYLKKCQLSLIKEKSANFDTKVEAVSELSTILTSVLDFKDEIAPRHIKIKNIISNHALINISNTNLFLILSLVIFDSIDFCQLNGEIKIKTILASTSEDAKIKEHEKLESMCELVISAECNKQNPTNSHFYNETNEPFVKLVMRKLSKNLSLTTMMDDQKNLQIDQSGQSILFGLRGSISKEIELSKNDKNLSPSILVKELRELIFKLNKDSKTKIYFETRKPSKNLMLYYFQLPLSTNRN